MRLNNPLLAEIAYTAQQEGLAQMNGVPGAQWSELNQTERDEQTGRVTLFLEHTNAPVSPITGVVGEDEPAALRADRIFFAVINTVR